LYSLFFSDFALLSSAIRTLKGICLTLTKKYSKFCLRANFGN
jgi:hypothetical protein